MPDLAKATKDAAFARLNGQVGAPVFDIPPEGAVVPVVLIDGIASTAPETKGGGLRLMSGTLTIFSQGRSRDELRAIMESIVTRLDGYRPAATTVALGDFMVGDTSDETLSDGLTHVGRVGFSVFAQPA